MMSAGCFLCRNLEAVTRGHDACEFVVAHIDGAGNSALDIGFPLQPLAQRDDPGLRLLQVCNDLPML